MPGNMTGRAAAGTPSTTSYSSTVHGVSVAGRYGPVIQIGDPSLIPLYSYRNVVFLHVFLLSTGLPVHVPVIHVLARLVHVRTRYMFR